MHRLLLPHYQPSPPQAPPPLHLLVLQRQAQQRDQRQGLHQSPLLLQHSPEQVPLKVLALRPQLRQLHPSSTSPLLSLLSLTPL